MLPLFSFSPVHPSMMCAAIFVYNRAPAPFARPKFPHNDLIQNSVEHNARHVELGLGRTRLQPLVENKGHLRNYSGYMHQRSPLIVLARQ